jgi:hypothetical protein
MPGRQLLPLVALIAAAVGFGGGWKLNGWRSDIELAALRAAHARELGDIAKAHAAMSRLAADVTQELAGGAHHSAIQLEEVKAHANAEFDRLAADVRSGRERLSVPARGCAVAAGSDPAAAAANPQARAELDAEAAARILAIGKDGDDAITELNVCIDRYEAAREALNKFKQDRIEE